MKTPDKQPYRNARSVTAEVLLRSVEPVQPETKIEKIFSHFSANQSLRAIPVVKNGHPVGLINRYEFVDSFAQSSHRELSGKKTCADIMNAAPLLVEKSTPIHELSGFLSESDVGHFTDGFIITQQGYYIGFGTGQDLLRELTRAQQETARYANPLTSLPGNIPINEHIEDLLESGNSFAVCYCDLNDFKPFNDVYGYRKGDEVIQFIGKLLGKVCDPKHDFIGHVGGDDFVLVLQSKDWEQRCNQALVAFAQTSAALFDAEHRSIGGYLRGDRQGRLVHHPLPTLSIGAIWIDPESFSSHHEVAEAALAAQKMAKAKPGNSLFIEKRRLHPHESKHETAHAYYG